MNIGFRKETFFLSKLAHTFNPGALARCSVRIVILRIDVYITN